MTPDTPGSHEVAGDAETLARLAERRVAEASRRERERGSKVREVGLFAAGLGVIYSLLVLYLAFVLRNPRGDPSGKSLVMFLLPGAVMVLSGAWVLAARSRWAVSLAVAVVTLAFAADAVLSFNVVKLAFEAGAVVLVWRTAAKAFEEISAESHDPHEDTPDVSSAGST